MKVNDALVRIDDAILDRLQSIVSRIYVRTGADKQTVVRNIHVFNALVCMAWTMGMLRIEPIVAIGPTMIMLSEIMDAISAGNLIGNAETAKGYESAARKASNARLKDRWLRMILIRDFIIMAMMMIGFFVLLTSQMVFMGTFLEAFVIMIAPILILAGRTLPMFLDAVLPPHPGTRKATKHVRSTASATGKA